MKSRLLQIPGIILRMEFSIKKLVQRPLPSLHWIPMLIILLSKPILSRSQTLTVNLPYKAYSRNLDYYVNKAYSNSPLMLENTNLLLAGSLDSLKINASQKPLISANSVAQYIPNIGSYGYSQAITNGGNYIATLNLTQPLLNSYSKKSLLKAYQIRKDSLVNSGKVSFKELKKSLINQYILAYSDQKQIQFQKEILNLFINQETIFKKLVQTGVYKQIDYLTFLVSRQAEEITITQSEISFHNNITLLNQISGISDTITPILENPIIPTLRVEPIASTYQFHKYEIDSISLIQQRLAVNALYKPKINWTADAGFMAPNFDQFYKSFGASIGLNFSLPLYDGHQRKYTIQQIDLLENTRKAYVDFFKKQYEGQTLAYRKQLNDFERLESQLRNQLDYSERLIDVNRKLLNIGDLKINDFILALNNYKNIRFNLSQIEVNRLTLQNQINFWSNDYLPTPLK